MHLSELKALHVSQLLEMAADYGIEGANRLRKQELIFALLRHQAKKGESIFGDGCLEVLPDGFGFLRSPDISYLAGTDDIYVSPSQIRRFNLHSGDSIEGEIRTPKDGERYFALVKVDKINGEDPAVCKSKILFENLTPLHPNQMLRLERGLEVTIGWAQQRVEKAWPGERGNPRTENFVAKYVTVLVLFSASGMASRTRRGRVRPRSVPEMPPTMTAALLTRGPSMAGPPFVVPWGFLLCWNCFDIFLNCMA